MVKIGSESLGLSMRFESFVLGEIIEMQRHLRASARRGEEASTSFCSGCNQEKLQVSLRALSPVRNQHRSVSLVEGDV